MSVIVPIRIFCPSGGTKPIADCYTVTLSIINFKLDNKMKKFILTVVVALLSVFGVAAESNVQLSVKAGVGAAGWIGDDADGANAKFAYRVGLGVDVPISGMWGFQTGLNFAGMGAKGDSDLLDLTVNQLYLEVPLMATARVDAGNGLGIVFNAGPYLACGVGGKTKVSGSNAELSSDTFGDGGLRRFDAGLGFGMNFEFNRFMVGVDTRFGLAKLASDAKAHNFGVFFGVGYKF